MLPCIYIHSDDVHIFIPRIPIRRLTIPHPNQVVQSVFLCQGMVKIPVELAVRLAALCAPPEPAAAGFVKGTPQNGHTGLLHFQQLLGNVVDILSQQPQALCILTVHNGGEIHLFGFLRTEGTVPGAGNVFLRSKPVPAQGDNPSLFPAADGLLGGLDGNVMVFAGLGIVSHIQPQNRRDFPAVVLGNLEILPAVHSGIAVLTGNNLLAILVAEITEQALCVIGCILVGQFGADLKDRFIKGAAGQDIHLVPVDIAPIFQYRDGMLPGFQIHPADGISHKFCTVGADGAQPGTVHKDIVFLVAALGFDQELQIIKARFPDGNRHRAGVPLLLKAGDAPLACFPDIAGKAPRLGLTYRYRLGLPGHFGKSRCMHPGKHRQKGYGSQCTGHQSSIHGRLLSALKRRAIMNSFLTFFSFYMKRKEITTHILHFQMIARILR